jgi:folate-binding protein YgfZ
MSSSSAYHAARHTSAFIDLSRRGRIVVTGDDRASYLQGLLTNDITTLPSGAGCYSAYLTPQGRMLADMQVLNLGVELLLDVHPSVTAMLVDRLQKFVFAEDVTIQDRTTLWTAFGLHGPESTRVVSDLLHLGQENDLASAGPGIEAASEIVEYSEYRHRGGRFEGVPVLVVRSDEIGERGFTLYTDATVGTQLADALVGAGAEALDVATFDLLRVEAGRPAFPVDLGPDTIPLEAGIEDRAISMTKGCYVGQEVIVRILHRGQGRVGRRLVGLVFEPSAEPPDVGVSLRRRDDAQAVGVITSAVWSPALGRPIALGYVKRELAEIGTELVADVGGRQLAGVITERPFLPGA